jgi:putative ABC transport system substrate-binding protein
MESETRNRLMQLGVLAIALVLLVPPLAAQAQQPGKVPRVGVLGLFAPELGARSVAAVREGRGELGWREGQNLHFEVRHASGKRDLLGPHAAELVQQKVDVIVAVGTDASFAAKGATSTIPIVMAGVADPVGTGLVASLARPGGNVTGMSLLMSDVMGSNSSSSGKRRPRCLASACSLSAVQDTIGV